MPATKASGAKSESRKPSSKKGGNSGGRTRWWLVLLSVSIVLLAIPLVAIASLRWVDPPTTMPMLLRKSRSGGGAPPVRYQWRTLESMPRDFPHFVLLAEDQRFFQHHGFDWQELRAARKQAETTGRPIRGASTISMQCARSLFLWQGRSWIRKGLEAGLTFYLETLLPKRRILELYCNVVEMGDGVYGLAAASQAHYGMEPRNLSREQCARLAALLPAPLAWNPKQPSARYAHRIERLLRDEPHSRVPGWEGLKLGQR